MLSANPHFGYSVKENVDVAVVLNFQSNKYEVTEQSILNLLNNQSTAKVSMLGFGTFARYYLLDVAFLQIQPEINYVTVKETKYAINGLSIPTGVTSKNSYLKPSLLVGVGYKRGFNKGKTFGYASILYDVISNKSPYSNGILSIANNNKSTPILLRAGFNVMLSDLSKKNK
jgi:hypothetical protein